RSASPREHELDAARRRDRPRSGSAPAASVDLSARTPRHAALTRGTRRPAAVLVIGEHPVRRKVVHHRPGIKASPQTFVKNRIELSRKSCWFLSTPALGRDRDQTAEVKSGAETRRIQGVSPPLSTECRTGLNDRTSLSWHGCCTV